MILKPAQRRLRDLALLLALAAVLYFYQLGRAPLGNPDEGRYAEIPREMAATGDWVTPRLDGTAYFEKPPLVYWAEAAALELFGPNEWSLRAVPALFALAGIVLTYLAAARLYGRAAGAASAFILATCAFYYGYAHLLSLDLAVAVLMSAALFCFILGVREPPGRRRLLLFHGLYAAAALATLTKGLIGFLVTGAVMFLWLLLLGQWRRLRPLHLPTGAALFLAIALPWHWLAAARNPAWAHFYLVHEHWERFTTTQHGRAQPWWYFLPIVLLGFFPWSGFLWGAARRRLAGGWAARRENAEAWFLVVWAGFVLLFFSLSQSKLPGYILPVFPPLAVLAGSAFAPPDLRTFRGGLRGFALLAALLGAGALAVALRPGLLHEPGQGAMLHTLAWEIAGILFAAAAAALGLTALRREREALAAGLMCTVFFYFALNAAWPFIPRPGTKELALQVRATAGPADEVVHYHEFFHDFTFYAGRAVDVVGFKGELEPENDASAAARARFIDEAEFRRRWAGPGRVFAVARKGDVGALFADPAFHYRLIGESRGHYLFTNRP